MTHIFNKSEDVLAVMRLGVCEVTIKGLGRNGRLIHHVLSQHTNGGLAWFTTLTTVEHIEVSLADGVLDAARYDYSDGIERWYEVKPATSVGMLAIYLNGQLSITADEHQPWTWRRA